MWDKMHGQGKMVYLDGSKYSGQWVFGRRLDQINFFLKLLFAI